MTTASMNTSGEGISITRDMYEQVMTPNYAPMAILPERGQGCRLWDTDGKEYLDFAGGIAVSVLGHAHPELIKALTDQANKFWHLSNFLTNKPAIQLAKTLCESTFAERVFLANSGAEVNEAALKLARRYAIDKHGKNKIEILAFDNAFHGRTWFTVCVGGQPKYSDGFGPKPGGISHRPFNDATAVKKYFTEQGDKVCAVIVEPVQGEGGVTPATAEFVQTIRECCDTHNALMIFDEIQTGVGRSGKLYTYEKLAVTPDILTTAKALGGGFPISAMLTTEEIASSLVVGTHGSTFGGNPMACAVACKVLELINTPEMLSGVETKSHQMIDGLKAINQKHNVFDDIRGVGLLLGCEMNAHYKDRAREVLSACTENGLLVLVAGANVVRLAPPLNISESEINQGLALMDNAIQHL
ncbi:acetylornithine/succinyldiaminopimelate transaminase [Candidatus Spongiihabitans sp.]|uniref:acetylornithine/succinyldiaminopimelate transaminase n=1 Tax=Candidatus Spongiihabitans sp. TaxID=3101308 RepID=UPI003C6FE964